MTKTEVMTIKTDAMRMVATSIQDYAREMPDVDGDGPHNLFNKRLQRHLNKISAHLIEGAAVVDVLHSKAASHGG